MHTALVAILIAGVYFALGVAVGRMLKSIGAQDHDSSHVVPSSSLRREPHYRYEQGGRRARNL